MSDELNRREFLEKSTRAALAAGVGLAGLRLGATEAEASVMTKRVGPNDKVVVGVIGTGGMGRADMRFFMQNSDVQIGALCDVYKPNLAEAVKMAGPDVPTYGDFRQVLDRKDIDAVIVATPDHWHCMIGVMACMAGKDVYCEKPLSIDIAQGRDFVKAARKYGRVVQTGTQQRSGTHFQNAVLAVQRGVIGRVSSAQVWIVGNLTPDGIGNPPDEPPPADLDWEMWQGPAKRHPYNKNRCIYNFRWFWDYSGGKMTDWGTHLIDIIHWATGVDYPLAVSASGGKYVLRDNRETPDTMVAVFDYPGFTMTWTQQDANGYGRDGHGYGMQLHGTEGTIFIDRGGWAIIPEGKRIEAAQHGGSPQNEPHVRDFLDCVKSRNKPRSDVEICHRSTSACHLANISLWTKRKIVWDGAKEEIVGDKDAAKHLRRPTTRPWAMPKL
ncbi:MAG: dehydrogenase [Fimbriimonadales bacterium]